MRINSQIKGKFPNKDLLCPVAFGAVRGGSLKHSGPPNWKLFKPQLLGFMGAPL